MTSVRVRASAGCDIVFENRRPISCHISVACVRTFDEVEMEPKSPSQCHHTCCNSGIDCPLISKGAKYSRIIPGNWYFLTMNPFISVTLMLLQTKLLTNAHSRTRAHTHTHTYKHTLYIHTHAHTQTHTNVHGHTRTGDRASAYTRKYAHTYIHKR